MWQKLVPLAVIFFCAGFNLTLIQNASHSLMVRRCMPWSRRLRWPMLSGVGAELMLEARDVSSKTMQ